MGLTNSNQRNADQTAELQSGSIIFHKILYVSSEQSGHGTEPFTNELQNNKSQLPLANPFDLFPKSHFFVTSSDAVSKVWVLR